jgi:CubicO group peptidase (beta-lactamase class C family)
LINKLTFPRPVRSTRYGTALSLAVFVSLCLFSTSFASAQLRSVSGGHADFDAANLRRGAAARKPESRPNPSDARLTQLRRQHRPEAGYGGVGCPSAGELRELLDVYLATPHPGFPELGPNIPGASTSWSAPGCGTFNYAAGLRNIENDRPLTPATPMSIASMTKPIIAAVTLKLNESGAFGPDGLDTTIDGLLTAEQITELTVGGDLLHPRCPGTTYLRNRDTQQFEFISYSCPDLSQVSLRHLMMSNHGMYDFLNEVLEPNGISSYDSNVYFGLYQYLGLNPAPPPNSGNGYDQLKSFGLKTSSSAVVGGVSGKDWESSLGNTGFQLLAVILETRTGKSLDELVAELIVQPLGLDPINVYVDPDRRRNLIADSYDTYTGDLLFETTGVYPIVDFNGHSALNNRSLGLGHPGNINLAGGAGALISNPRSYQIFLNAFLNGGLLGPAAQAEMDQSYTLIPDFSFPPFVTVSNGYGIVKIQVRGLQELRDVDYYQHNGALPGALCSNAVLRDPETQSLVATGVVCQNSGYTGFPQQFYLFDEFMNKFLDARE